LDKTKVAEDKNTDLVVKNRNDEVVICNTVCVHCTMQCRGEERREEGG